MVSHRDASIVDGSIGIDGSFVAPPADASWDGAIVPACSTPEPCDPIALTGCTDVETCVLAATEPACLAQAGPGPQGEACTSTTDCAEGLACFATRSGTGACRRLCCGDAATCEVDERCGAGVLVDGSPVSWGRCAPSQEECAPLDPLETCDPGEACYVVTAGGDTGCRPPGAGDAGDPCREQNDCLPGFACRGLSDATCKRICDTTEESPCPTGEGACEHPSGWPENTGLCTVNSVRYLD
ncbi:MAG: hypothetical protein ACOCXM_00045 [Myxococcota bacterium]